MDHRAVRALVASIKRKRAHATDNALCQLLSKSRWQNIQDLMDKIPSRSRWASHRASLSSSVYFSPLYCCIAAVLAR
jgi:hypothetical protein